ncbi:MAG: hypothetical protein EBZ48_06615 [Proteobacteria bacterium]|nr:hypothetical protein [Pseudomonadota bacterium]
MFYFLYDIIVYMKELLKFLTNGQWQLLEKGSLQRRIGKPNPEYQQFADEAYIPETNPANTKRGQLELLKQLSNNKHSIKNIDGKTHVLLHRGMGGVHDPEFRASPINISEDSLSHSGFGMYTDNPDYASSFGKLHSVWVPLENVNRNAHYLQDSAQKKLKVFDPEELQALGEAGYGEVMDRGNHVLVNPGTYKRASLQEVQNSINFKPKKPEVRKPAIGSRNLYEGSMTGEGNTRSAKWQGSDPRHVERLYNEEKRSVVTRAGQPVPIAGYTSPSDRSNKTRAVTAGVSDLGYSRVETGKPVSLNENTRRRK